MRLPDEEELHAAELAFGLLEREDRRAAEARAAADPSFAAAVAAWQDRALGFDESQAALPRPSLWPAIVARLPGNDNRGTSGWKLATAAASMVAALLLFLLVRPVAVPPAPRPAPAAPLPVVAVLAAPDNRAVVTISYDRASGRLTLAPAHLAPGAGHAAELWVIPAGGSPRSMGVIRADAPATLRARNDAAALLRAGATLAVSVEPAGGSPTGQPTGPVIITGKATIA